MKIKRDPYLPQIAAERDKFICQICNIDTKQIQDVLNEIRLIWILASGIQSRAKYVDINCWDAVLFLKYKNQLRTYYLMYSEFMTHEKRHKLDTVPRLIKEHAWEVDHIVPLALGGTDCLDNLRTLCCECHAVETRKLKEELVKRRKRAKKRGIK